ncbi:hypothetical protein BJ742DRAFT_850583 [Cladochytrium replicatum]|nr:hypothetical protein BJ742DRAFT_850583 [Cladochytrium replicatum]
MDPTKRRNGFDTPQTHESLKTITPPLVLSFTRPDSCFCETHPPHLALDVLVDRDIRSTFELVFASGGTQTVREAYMLRDAVDLSFTEWEQNNMHKSTRLVTYKCSFAGPLGKIRSQCDETQTIITRESRCLVVETSSMMPQVPYGSSFRTVARYCLNYVAEEVTRLRVTVGCEFSRPIVLRSFLERAALDGALSFFQTLGSKVKASHLQTETFKNDSEHLTSRRVHERRPSAGDIEGIGAHRRRRPSGPRPLIVRSKSVPRLQVADSDFEPIHSNEVKKADSAVMIDGSAPASPSPPPSLIESRGRGQRVVASPFSCSNQQSRPIYTVLEPPPRIDSLTKSDGIDVPLQFNPVPSNASLAPPTGKPAVHFSAPLRRRIRMPGRWFREQRDPESFLQVPLRSVWAEYHTTPILELSMHGINMCISLWGTTAILLMSVNACSLVLRTVIGVIQGSGKVRAESIIPGTSTLPDQKWTVWQSENFGGAPILVLSAGHGPSTPVILPAQQEERTMFSNYYQSIRTILFYFFRAFF